MEIDSISFDIRRFSIEELILEVYQQGLKNTEFISINI
jgi:hypothetical protein